MKIIVHVFLWERNKRYIGRVQSILNKKAVDNIAAWCHEDIKHCVYDWNRALGLKGAVISVSLILEEKRFKVVTVYNTIKWILYHVYTIRMLVQWRVVISLFRFKVAPGDWIKKNVADFPLALESSELGTKLFDDDAQTLTLLLECWTWSII